MGLYQERVIAPEFRAVLNSTGSTIAKGTILKLHTTGVPGQIVKAAAAADQFYGVASRDIPNGEYGDAQIKGVAIVLAGAAIAQGAQVTSDANGKAATAATGNTLLGMAVTAAGADLEFLEVELGGGGEAN